MKYAYLSETVSAKTVSLTETEGVFEVEGLYAGYGLTVGNALRRAILSSLPGGAITQVRIKNVNHEFSTLPGMAEDVIELSLNLKKLRFRVHTDEPQVLKLKIKGEKEVTAADIEMNSSVEVINPDAHIATLTAKSAELDMELTVEKGLGYMPVEARKAEKLPVGTIALDALFSPVKKVNFTVENMRVGERTDYNKVRLVIETDGSISPQDVLRKASNILKDHFAKISAIGGEKEAGEIKTEEAPAEAEGEKEAKVSKRKSKKKAE